MKAKIYPSKVSGIVNIPSSKSITHRALICGALAKGKSIIHNVDLSNDILSTIEGIRAIGCEVDIINKDVIIISDKYNDSGEFNAFESGTTLRFMMSITALLGNYIIHGSDKLLSRPLDEYKNIIDYSISKSVIVKKGLKGGNIKINGDISSQFISGLLFTLPKLNIDSKIEVIGKFESKSYVDLTIDVLKSFGIKIEEKDQIYYIKGNQNYQNCEYTVEGDYSQASFFIALGLINNDITIRGLRSDSLQGDKKILSFVQQMNGRIEDNKDLKIMKSDLTGGTFDMSDCPDLAPIMMVLGSVANNQTKLTNVERLKIKESNRIDSMILPLNLMGGSILYSDSINILGKKYFSTNEILDPSNDHRIFMSLSILSTIAKESIIINNVECINKSYPEFINDLRRVGVKVEIYE